MNVFEAINTRNQSKISIDKPVSQQDLKAVFGKRLFLAAPSAKNRQNLKFIVVDDPTLDKMCEACCNQPMSSSSSGKYCRFIA